MKVAIYCRLSEEDRNKKSRDDDSESIQNQKSMLLQYALDNDWEVTGVYNDDDFTGADRNRPDWKRLLSDAEQKKFNVILCKSQSRFTRELEMVEKYLHGLFPIWGIRFIGLADNADTDNRGNKKSRQINGLVNEWYLEDLSENIKTAFNSRRKEGLHIGSFALYGYIKDPDNKGCLLIDETAAAVVREVFTLYASGYGRTAIANLLNVKGIPNPTEYKRLTGAKYKTPKHKTGTLWKYFTISDMLANEMYIGNMVQGRYGSISYKTGQNKPRPKSQWFVVEGTHEAIIARDLWDMVQESIRQNAKPFITGKVGLFARKARCMYCDCTMRSSKNHDKHYLKCETKHIAKDACKGSFIPVAQLERAVLSELRGLLENYLNPQIVESRVSISDNFDNRIENLLSQKSAYEKIIAEFQATKKILYNDKIKGTITEQDFIELSRDYASDRERYEALIKETETEMSTLERKRTEVKDKRAIVEEYSNIERLDRVMVERLIDYIIVGKRDPKTRIVPISIYWNF